MRRAMLAKAVAMVLVKQMGRWRGVDGQERWGKWRRREGALEERGNGEAGF